MPNNYDLLADYLGSCYITVKKYCRQHGGADALDQDKKAKDLLKSVNFEGGALPDYDNKAALAWYHIRYLYAYAYEYRQMYCRLLRKLNAPKVMKILSIGCGNGIDYWAAWAAQRMLKQKTGKGKRIEYTGLDLADWDRKWGIGKLRTTKEHCVSYWIGDAVRYLKQTPVLNQNIFVFPKSISEFSEEDFDKLCEFFARAQFQFKGRSGGMFNRRKIYFLISCRSQKVTKNPPDMENPRHSDILRVRILADKLVNAGIFSRVEGLDKAYTWLDDFGGEAPEDNPYGYIHRLDTGFNQVYNDFYLAPRVEDFLAKLTGKRGKNEDGKFDEGPYGIKKPVWSADYAFYQILTFHREDQT